LASDVRPYSRLTRSGKIRDYAIAIHQPLPLICKVQKVVDNGTSPTMVLRHQVKQGDGMNLWKGVLPKLDQQRYSAIHSLKMSTPPLHSLNTPANTILETILHFNKYPQLHRPFAKPFAGKMNTEWSEPNPITALPLMTSSGEVPNYVVLLLGNQHTLNNSDRDILVKVIIVCNN
jgi:hypothetical protein